MATCSKCGEAMLDTDPQCMNCGQELPRGSAPGGPSPRARPSGPPAAQPTNPVATWAGRIVVGVLIAVVLACVGLPMSPSKLDGTWETSDQTRVLYIDVGAGTIDIEYVTEESQVEGDVMKETISHITRKYDGVSYKAKLFGTIAISCSDFELRAKPAFGRRGKTMDMQLAEGGTPIVTVVEGDLIKNRNRYRRQ